MFPGGGSESAEGQDGDRYLVQCWYTSAQTSTRHDEYYTITGHCCLLLLHPYLLPPTLRMTVQQMFVVLCSWLWKKLWYLNNRFMALSNNIFISVSDKLSITCLSSLQPLELEKVVDQSQKYFRCTFGPKKKRSFPSNDQLFGEG